MKNSLISIIEERAFSMGYKAAMEDERLYGWVDDETSEEEKPMGKVSKRLTRHFFGLDYSRDLYNFVTK